MLIEWLEKLKRSVKMPEDWHDQEAWEKYHSRSIQNGDFLDKARNTGSISIRDIPQLVTEFRSNGIKNVWIPGCGISLLPKLLAASGFDVHASDISRSAIDFQNCNSRSDVESCVEQLHVAGNASGSLTAVVHDIHTDYLSEYFDLIINVKAIQGFSAESILQIARVHHTALKPGCQTIFDTMNVQGERRDTLEKCIVKAGFFIPFHDLNVWYRSKLQDTGLPYVFVLGQPIIPWHGEYAENETKRETDMGVLRAISLEYHEKQKAQAESVKEHFKEHPETRTANIIYSTG